MNDPIRSPKRLNTKVRVKTEAAHINEWRNKTTNLHVVVGVSFVLAIRKPEKKLLLFFYLERKMCKFTHLLLFNGLALDCSTMIRASKLKSNRLTWREPKRNTHLDRELDCWRAVHTHTQCMPRSECTTNRIDEREIDPQFALWNKTKHTREVQSTSESIGRNVFTLKCLFANGQPQSGFSTLNLNLIQTLFINTGARAHTHTIQEYEMQSTYILIWHRQLLSLKMATFFIHCLSKFAVLFIKWLAVNGERGSYLR